jgi:hypothetical protein
LAALKPLFNLDDSTLDHCRRGEISESLEVSFEGSHTPIAGSRTSVVFDIDHSAPKIARLDPSSNPNYPIFIQTRPLSARENSFFLVIFTFSRSVSSM